MRKALQVGAGILFIAFAPLAGATSLEGVLPTAAEPDIVYHEPVDLLTLRALGGGTPVVYGFSAFNDTGVVAPLRHDYTGGFVRSVSNAICVVQAPVSLPDGVTIESVYAYLYDDAPGTSSFWLMRKAFGTVGFTETLASGTSIGEFPFVQLVGDQTVSSPVVNNVTYHYFLVVSLSASVGGAALDERLYAVVVVYQEPSSVSAPFTSGPAADERALAHPNPFRTRSDVRFSLPGPETVDVTVFDVSGRLLRNLHSGRLDSGVHDVSWDGRDRAGRRVAGGVYYVRVRSATRDLVTRMVRVE